MSSEEDVACPQVAIPDAAGPGRGRMEEWEALVLEGRTFVVLIPQG